MNAGQRAALGLIRVYQLTASALLGRQCRYLPSCSDYAAEAVRRHGLWPGAWMAGARLCRCHPFGAWGYDPVPLRCEAVPTAKPWRYGVWRMPTATDLPLVEQASAPRRSADVEPMRGGSGRRPTPPGARRREGDPDAGGAEA